MNWCIAAVRCHPHFSTSLTATLFRYSWGRLGDSPHITPLLSSLVESLPRSSWTFTTYYWSVNLWTKNQVTPGRHTDRAAAMVELDRHESGSKLLKQNVLREPGSLVLFLKSLHSIHHIFWTGSWFSKKEQWNWQFWCTCDNKCKSSKMVSLNSILPVYLSHFILYNNIRCIFVSTHVQILRNEPAQVLLEPSANLRGTSIHLQDNKWASRMARGYET